MVKRASGPPITYGSAEVCRTIPKANSGCCEQFHSYISCIMPINIALAGSGIFAQTSYIPALKKITDVVRLHSIWSRSSASTGKLLEAAKSAGLVQTDNDIKISNGPEGLEKVLSDPEVDAVAFVLPISAQPEYIIQALKAGKHVLSEKPVGKDLETAKELIKVYETDYKPKGLIWRVAESE